MSFVLRDTQPIIIHIDETAIRAGIAAGELFPRPALILPACCSAKPGSSSELVAGAAEGSQTRWPFRASSDDWEGREFLLNHVFALLGIDSSSNASPVLLVPPRPLSLPESALYTQLAFEKLNTPGFSILSAPLAALFALNATTGIVVHVEYETTTVSVVVDTIVRECGAVVQLGQADVEKAFAWLLAADEGVDRELKLAAGTAEWAAGQKEALVKELVDVVIAECSDDIDVALAHTGSAASVPPPPVTEEDAFDVAKKLVGEAVPQQAPKTKKVSATAKAAAAAADAAAADVVTVTLPSLGKEVTVGQVRHKLLDPLLKGTETGGDTVWEGIGRAVDHPCLSPSERISVYDAVAVTGELARVRSFQNALITYLAPFLLSSADLVSDSQPSRARALTIPDYLTNFKGATNDLAPFLGGSMVAKASFTDTAGKHCVTKIDYNAKGPAAIYAVTTEA